MKGEEKEKGRGKRQPGDGEGGSRPLQQRDETPPSSRVALGDSNSPLAALLAAGVGAAASGCSSADGTNDPGPGGVKVPPPLRAAKCSEHLTPESQAESHFAPSRTS